MIASKQIVELVITIRDKNWLLIGRVHEIYDVKELNFEDSLKLFSFNAYKELSKRVMVYAKGNPLALKILGSLFHSKSIEICEGALENIICKLM